MLTVVQSRYPTVPYCRFPNEDPETPFPGEDGCGCRAGVEEVADAIHDATPHTHPPKPKKKAAKKKAAKKKAAKKKGHH